MTCSSWPGIGADRAEVAAVLDDQLRPSRRAAASADATPPRRRREAAAPAGASVCWREKASSWRVRPAARFEFDLICWMSS